jgi:hypothetical protein
MILYRVFLVLLFLFGLAGFVPSGSVVSAQEGHYWTEFYGTRSTILNGIVIGSVDDLAAVYYNPARLGLIDNPGVILSGKVYEWSLLEIEDALGEGLDLSASKFGGVPSLAAGTFRLPFLPRHQFGYAFLTRYRQSTDLFARDLRKGDILEAYPGIETIDEKIFLALEAKEEWFGVSWSYPLSERVSIGFTGFYADRSKKNSIDLRITALSQGGQVAQLLRNRAIGYSANGLLGKFGLAADLFPVTLGVTVTTPKWNFGGKGHLVYEEIFNGWDLDDDGVDEDRFETSLQKDLPSKHRWPWSVGVGAGVTHNKHLLHFSAEWFGPVSGYTLLESEEFIGQTSGDTLSFRIVDDLKSVLNFGLGYEYLFSDRYSVHTSFATDRSAVRGDVNGWFTDSGEISNSTLRKDFFHFGGGASLTFDAVEFTLGATYTTAAQRFERPLDPLGVGEDPPPESGETSLLSADRVRFLFGFELFFLDDLRSRGGSK